jgi:hypothetical protein
MARRTPLESRNRVLHLMKFIEKEFQFESECDEFWINPSDYTIRALSTGPSDTEHSTLYRNTDGVVTHNIQQQPKDEYRDQLSAKGYFYAWPC